MSDKYIFNLSRLEPGDILLSRQDSRRSKAIAKITGGNYSHAMLLLGTSIIHADLGGVYSKNPQRLTFDSPDDFIALRAKSRINASQMRAIEVFSRDKVGTLYSVGEAGLSPILRKTSKTEQGNRQYCSKLVAQCYQSAGIKIVQNPSYCTPNDISKSEVLEVVEEYAKKATAAELAILEKHDYNLDLQQATFTWLKLARKLAKNKMPAELQTINQAFELVIRHKNLDKPITQAAKDSGYFDYYNADRRNNPYRYDPDLFLDMVRSNSFHSLLAQESDICDREFFRVMESLQAATENQNKYPRELLHLHVELNTKRMNEVMAWRNSINHAKANHIHPE
jgi:Permuted papain-like amidase enzyme, YaeF/YiiX, C92 family